MKYDLLKVKFRCTCDSPYCRPDFITGIWICPHLGFCNLELLYTKYWKAGCYAFTWMEHYCEMIYSEGEVDESSII